nr:MAG TPA: hypothetical protein [Caudoviricetes sp.]
MYGARYELPTLYNWMDATLAERDIKPIRGKPDCKPLGKRRNTHVAIRKVDNEAIACRLYQTDVVTFHKDGRIVIRLDGWSSQTTIAFIEEVLNVRGCIRRRHAWLGVTRQGSTQEGWYALRAHEDNIFRRNGQGDLEFENPMQIKTHRVNRAGANNVRKQYKAFKDYVVRTMRLRDDGFSAQEYGDVFGWVHSELPNYPVQLWVSPSGNLNVEMVRDLLSLARSEQVQDQYKASLWLARSASKGMRNNRWTPSEADMLRMLGDYILLVHRDECFTETYAGGGDVVRAPYAKFFGR